MKWSPPKSRFIGSLVALVVTLLAMSFGVAQDPLPTTDAGLDTIVVYNKERQPVRRLNTLPPFTQCGAHSPELFLVYVNMTGVAQFHDSSGSHVRTVPLGARAIRASRTDKGFIFVLDTGPIVELEPTGGSVGSVNSRDVMWADKLPAGGYIAVSRGGELQIYDAGSEKPRRTMGAAELGRPVLFSAVAVLRTSQILAFDESAKELVWFDADMRELSRKPFNLSQPTIFLPLQEGATVMVKGAQEEGLRFVNSDQSVTTYTTPLAAVCAGTLPDGGFLVGYSGKGGIGLINAPFDNVENRIARLTYDCLFAIVVYAFVGALCFAYAWIGLMKRLRRAPIQVALEDECCSSRCDVVASSDTRARGSRLLTFFSVALVFGGIYGAWVAYPGLMDPTTPMFSLYPVPVSWIYFLIGWGVAGASMVYLGKRFEIAPRLRPLSDEGLERRSGNRVFWFLIVVSLALACVANYLNIYGLSLVGTPEAVNQSPKTIVACWIAAQVLIVMAVRRAAPSPSPDGRRKRAELWSVVALCVVAFLSRIIWLEDYPHNIHHDFGVMGHHIYRYLLEPWYPFFKLDGGEGVGRPWYMQMAGLLWLFGVHDWSLRLSSVIWAVGFVLAAYLIGRETVSHRFGLIFGSLVCAQHNLLEYSRCPYVTESTAPFLFCLYYLCRGFRTGCARDFAVAGVWGSWSVMTVRNFTPFPFIGAALFVFFCLVYGRRMWALRWQVLLMFTSAMVVFGPFVYFYLFQQTLPDLLASMSPLYKNHQITTDLRVWTEQFKRAFGGFIVYPDRISWNMETLAPICIAFTSALFGVGLIVLLSRVTSVGAAAVLITIVVDTILGSAFLEYPPSYYHVFVAIALAMYLVALPLEFLWQLSERIHMRFARWIASGCLTIAAIGAVVEEVWPFVEYSLPRKAADGVFYPKYDTHTFIARYVLNHRDRRFLAVSRPGNLYEFHSATISILYGEFSERFELMADVNLYIPVRPGPVRRATTFFIDAPADLEKVRAVYPTGDLESFTFSNGERSLMSYTVSADEIERVWKAESLSASAPRLAPFALKPS